MYYDRTLELMILAGFALVMLPFIISAYRNRVTEPPEWAQQANGPVKPEVVKRARGYDPVVRVAVGYDVKCVDLGRLK